MSIKKFEKIKVKDPLARVRASRPHFVTPKDHDDLHVLQLVLRCFPSDLTIEKIDVTSI